MDEPVQQSLGILLTHSSTQHVQQVQHIHFSVEHISHLHRAHQFVCSAWALSFCSIALTRPPNIWNYWQAPKDWISAKHHLQQRWHIWKSWKHNSFTNPQPAHPVRTEVSYSLIRKSVSLTTENKSFLAFIKQFHTEGKSDPVILSSPLSCLGTSSLLLLVFPTDPTKAFSAHSSPEHTCSPCRVPQGRICLYLVQSH